MSGDAAPRPALLKLVLQFVLQASACPGVMKIALLGSLTTSKPSPKDADVLVTVADDADLAPLATVGRRLQGAAQSLNRGADVFLANPAGDYIGRICPWRECRFGIRSRCDARHCARRPYLHNDLDTITLSPALVREPPVELWPEVVRRAVVPEDVEREVLVPLDLLPPE